MTVKDVEKICEVCNVINVDEVIKQCARLIDADDFLKWLDVGHLRNPGEVCFCEAE